MNMKSGKEIGRQGPKNTRIQDAGEVACGFKKGSGDARSLWGVAPPSLPRPPPTSTHPLLPFLPPLPSRRGPCPPLPTEENVACSNLFHFDQAIVDESLVDVLHATDREGGHHRKGGGNEEKFSAGAA